MRFLLAGFFGILILAAPATGEEIVRCAVAPSAVWIPEADMRARIVGLGYRIDVFKKTIGGCYEIYGRKDGKRVEAYFHPITGERVHGAD